MFLNKKNAERNKHKKTISNMQNKYNKTILNYTCPKYIANL